ncbi:MAG: D-aminoacyl-tRNA deacylase [Candidatus Dichloromethanomonas elyunquensis]|nr:MAG: D-aminoacyl-tRNA deacylase [Candidatus Dichloromethanomonas elyunquensis]
MIWDTHAHLDDSQFETDREIVIERAREAGITTIVNIGHTESSCSEAVKLAGRYPFIYATVGIHPHDAKDCTEKTWELLLKLSQNPKVVAWGEIGLDYYRDLSPRDVQRQVFIRQLELANETGLPVIIHNRDAHGDIIEVIKKHLPSAGGVFHSYSGSWEMAEELLRLGFYLSFSGPLTFKNARHTLKVAVNVPEDRFVVETDSPYLTPEPYRGKRNEPGYVREVVAKIAEIKGLPFERVAQLSSNNAKRLFGL